MPTPIKLSTEEQEEILKNAIQTIKTQLTGNFENTTNLNIPITMKQVSTTKKPVVIFSDIANAKITKLVDACTGEVGWQGIVDRKDNIFVIKDILIYPQTVTSATVTVDELEYAQWLSKIPTDHLKKLRFQAHSHVNMSVTPSSTDTDLYNNYLKTLKDDDYYIFMIINKRNDINMWIYDLKTNLRYTTNEITIKQGFDTNAWYKKLEEENIIKKPRYTNYSYCNSHDDDDDFWSNWNKKYYGLANTAPNSTPKTTSKKSKNKSTKGGKKA